MCCVIKYELITSSLTDSALNADIECRKATLPNPGLDENNRVIRKFYSDCCVPVKDTAGFHQVGVTLPLLLPELTVHRSLCPCNQFLVLGPKQQRKVTHPRVAPLLRKEGPLPRPWVLACVRACALLSLWNVSLCHKVVASHSGGVVRGGGAYKYCT